MKLQQTLLGAENVRLQTLLNYIYDSCKQLNGSGKLRILLSLKKAMKPMAGIPETYLQTKYSHYATGGVVPIWIPLFSITL